MFYYFLHKNYLILFILSSRQGPPSGGEATRATGTHNLGQLGQLGHTNTQSKDRQSYSAELMSNPIFFGDFTFTGKEFMR